MKHLKLVLVFLIYFFYGECATAGNGIDVEHISLDIRVHQSQRKISGRVVTRLSVLQQTDTLLLDAGMLSIEKVQLKNGRLLQFKYSADRLTIILDRKYRAGERLNLQIDYSTNYVNETDPLAIGGSNGKGPRFFAPSSTEPHRQTQVWTMGEGIGNRYWFPCFDSPGDLRTTDLTATVEKKYMVISNGKLTETKTNKDGTRTFRYRMDTPYPNHKTVFVMGEYVEIKTRFNNIELQNFCYPHEKEATIATIDRLADMMKYFGQLTAQPYAYENYKQVFVQELPWGNGYAGISVQSENMIDDDVTHADYLYLWDMLEGETLASQWFGNLISIGRWNDYWLDKAFSRYFSCLYDEYKNGKEEFLLWQLTFDQFNYFADWANDNRMPVVPENIQNVNDFINSNYPNSRGALVLHMLRKELGEENWLKTLRQYVATNKEKVVGTKDLIDAIQKACDKDLQWFFDQWVYKAGHPVFKTEKKYDTAAKQFVLTLHQTQQPNFFKGNMQVEIDNRVETVFLEAKADNTFLFKSEQAPKLVNVDFEQTWIKEMEDDKSTEELLYELQHSKDVLARNNALTMLAGTYKNDSLSADKNKIKQAIQNIVADTRNYWRLRTNAFAQLQGMLAKQGSSQFFDKELIMVLLKIIQEDSSWVKAGAISLLGQTKDSSHADLYIMVMKDKSERVKNAAAIALGRSRSSKAYDALVNLCQVPSWKNQSIISALNGLAQLGDKRAIDVAQHYIDAHHLPHWTLGTPVWDHRLAAMQTLMALGGSPKAFTLVETDLKKAVTENNINDIFYHLLQINSLKDARAQACYDLLKEKFKDRENILSAVLQKEQEFKESIPSSGILMPRIDERVELLGIAYRLAMQGKYTDSLDQRYAASVNSHFARFSRHPFIQYLTNTIDSFSRKGVDISYRHIASLAVHVSEPPLFEPLVPLMDKSDDSWDDRSLFTEKMISLLRKFYVDTDAAGFFKSMAAYYQSIANAYFKQGILFNKMWVDDYFSLPPSETYFPILALTIQEGAYLRVNFDSTKRNAYTIFTCDTNFSSPDYLNSILHEYVHCYINQLIEKDSQKLRPLAEALLMRKEVYAKVGKTFYGNWRYLLYESMVRAISIRYKMVMNNVDNDIRMEEDAGFTWIRSLVNELEYYEKNRSMYKNFSDFMPRIILFFESMGK